MLCISIHKGDDTWCGDWNHEPMGTGALRNKVIAASEHRFGRGDYLYLSDNDVFFKPGWLSTLTAIYDALWPAFQVLGAYGHPFHQSISTPAVFADGHCVHEVTALATQSMLMRWEVWDKHGPFIETPVDRVCMSEDVDFINRVRRAGGRVGVVDPPLIVSTGITNTFGELIPGWEIVKAQAPEGVIVE
jgi:GT2 family glycosyltransferase